MKFRNTTRAAGVHVTEASPLDDRGYVTTEAEVAALSGVEPMPMVMYDGMVVQFSDTRREFIWVESSVGLMPVGFTYPDWYDNIQGVNYAGKTYNFLLFDKVSNVTVTYNTGDVGLAIKNKDIPYHILKSSINSIAQVTMRSNVTDYKELEFPDSVVNTPSGLTVILDPVPANGETFNITIS
jgi:hypothetical protein